MCKSQSKDPKVAADQAVVTTFGMFNMSFHGQSMVFMLAMIILVCLIIAVGYLIYKRCMVVRTAERLAIR